MGERRERREGGRKTGRARYRVHLQLILALTLYVCKLKMTGSSPARGSSVVALSRMVPLPSCLVSHSTFLIHQTMSIPFEQHIACLHTLHGVEVQCVALHVH